MCESPISVHGNNHKFTENREKLVTWSDEHKGRTVRLWQYTPGGAGLQVEGSFTPDLRVHFLILIGYIVKQFYNSSTCVLFNTNVIHDISFSAHLK